MEKMKKDIKIFVSHRIDLDSETIDNPLFIPVRCGAVYDKRENVTMLGDNTGDNISEKRNSFCELTVQYWAWKNVKADYYGLCHYRRYLSFSENIFSNLNEKGLISESYISDCKKYQLDNFEQISKLIEENDLVLPEYIDIKKIPTPNGYQNSVLKHWEAWDGILIKKEYLKKVLSILHDDNKEIYAYALEYLNGEKYIGYNCFIMNKAIFNSYCEFQFGVLFKLEKIIDTKYLSITMSRCFGFIGEILFGIYCYYLNAKNIFKIKRLQIVFFENTKKIPVLNPAFQNNNIPIVLLSSNYYVPYLGVFLKSLISKSNRNKNYDIIILEKEIDEKNKNKIINLSCNYRNFSIRFYNAKHLIKNAKFYIASVVYAEEAYYRLLTPWILEKYDKAIVMDCDIIVNQDISTLFDEEIEDYLAAGVKDIVWQGLVNNKNLDIKEYTEKDMGLKNPYNYINTGVLLMNLKKFREKYILEEFIKFAQSKKLRVQEQDLLNIVLENKVKFIDLKYNFYVETNNWVTEQLKLAPYSSYSNYDNVKKNPVLIHYANIPKPWFNPEIEFASDFWHVARETEFYEIIIARLSAEHANSATNWHQQNFHTKFLNQNRKQKIKNFIKIFFPAGTKRHAVLKRWYFKLRGWPV